MVFLSLTGQCRASNRVIFVGFDLSATAYQRGSNPYHDGWVQVLNAVSGGGDEVYAAAINGIGLANGAPPINFSVRPRNIFLDKPSDYKAAVDAKLRLQETALDEIVRAATPSRGTSIIGFLHTVAAILAAHPPGPDREIIIFTDGIEESPDINLAKVQLSDVEIKKLIETERRAGRLPALGKMNVFFVTGPSMHGQVTTDRILRLEAFWREYVKSCGGNLQAFSPVLANF